MKKLLPIVTAALLITNIVTVYLLMNRSDGGTCMGNTNYENTPMSGMLSHEATTQMTDSYAEEVTVATRTNGQQEIALATIFELEKLKNLIWKIENAACNSNCDINPELGIKYYYIKYPNNVDALPEGVPQSAAGKYSLTMAPAFKQDNVWYDFYIPTPENPAGNCVFFVPDDKKHLITTYNHAGLWPPPAGTKFPLTLSQTR